MAKNKATSSRRTIREHGPDPIDIKVGKRLRLARSLAELSQEALGAAIGISFQSVQKYECGENRVSASKLFQAAEALALPIAFFFEESSEAIDADGFNAKEIELVCYLRRVPNEVREALRQMIREMANTKLTNVDTPDARRKAE